MKKCPFCKAELLDDSFFCDQCGKELKICKECQSFVAGKFCTNCSSRNIILAKDYIPGQEPREDKPAPEKVSEQIVSSSVSNTVTPPVINRMVGINHEVTFELHSDKGKYTFGRKAGEFTVFFNSIRFISREHAEITFDNNHKYWSIVDLGSSNGTFVNGKKLDPDTAVKVSIGDVIQIAFAKFKFE